MQVWAIFATAGTITKTKGVAVRACICMVLVTVVEGLSWNIWFKLSFSEQRKLCFLLLLSIFPEIFHAFRSGFAFLLVSLVHIFLCLSQERLRRVADCNGVPRLTFASPEDFFAQLAASARKNNFPVWVGELVSILPFFVCWHSFVCFFLASRSAVCFSLLCLSLSAQLSHLSRPCC